jgi:threonine synthase
MDVGNPGNFPRILELYNNDLGKLKSDLSGYWFTDAQTKKALKFLMDEFSYQADPHGAVAFMGLSEYLKHDESKGIFLETAHPVKFRDIVEKSTGKSVEMPSVIGDLLNRKKHSVQMKALFSELKTYLIS